MKAYLPGSVIGILGGGQLGRMTILAGRNLGYRFAVFDPNEDCCAAQIADYVFTAPYSDEAALAAFADCCDTVTYEFENVSAKAASLISTLKPLSPGPDVLRVSQHRISEKNFLRDNHFPVAPFAPIYNSRDLQAALDLLGTPSVLKTATDGYDGKGQLKLQDRVGIDDSGYAAAIWQELGATEAVLEKWINFEKECSVIVARNKSGQVEVFPVAENQHRNHILDISLVPARLSQATQTLAMQIAHDIATKLNLIGVLAVEFFVLPDGHLLVNELAPRPHNSGHYSMDACTVSQFEQQLRAICNLPLIRPSLRSPVAMVNLLGDIWHTNKPPEGPNWRAVLEAEDCHLHLYDKGEPRVGRKMGHLNVLAPTAEAALQQAKRLRDSL